MNVEHNCLYESINPHVITELPIFAPTVKLRATCHRLKLPEPNNPGRKPPNPESYPHRLPLSTSTYSLPIPGSLARNYRKPLSIPSKNPHHGLRHSSHKRQNPLPTHPQLRLLNPYAPPHPSPSSLSHFPYEPNSYLTSISPSQISGAQSPTSASPSPPSPTRAKTPRSSQAR